MSDQEVKLSAERLTEDIERTVIALNNILDSKDHRNLFVVRIANLVVDPRLKLPVDGRYILTRALFLWYVVESCVVDLLIGQNFCKSLQVEMFQGYKFGFIKLQWAELSNVAVGVLS